MKIKTTLRFHLMPDRMIKVKFTDNNLWDKRDTLIILMGVETYTDTLEISMAISQKTGKQSTSIPNNTTFGYTIIP